MTDKGNRLANLSLPLSIDTFIDPNLNGRSYDAHILGARVIFVTGGNTGIEYETVKQLLLKNAKVYLAARSGNKASAAIERLKEETHKTAIFVQLDLADLASLPALAKSCEETKVSARVINTSSIGHQMLAPGQGIEFVSLEGGPERDAQLYGQSKMGNVLVSKYLAETYSDVLVSCSLHPGSIQTELGRMGAYTQLWGATVATAAQINGQYLVPWCKIGQADKRATNTELQEEVITYLK
ncbi:NAD(P)-binding protein [Mycena maculata]|uniref:NAD(P)-binding protein n=1 Tax=Mycena maculata TaxID=230809 RepID=A0AAD7MYN6_9AGAR|nr:NAD(P)-binding protein [Mycena maculata]